MISKRKNEKGQSLVELAWALPLLLLMLLGILKGGTAFYDWIILAEAVQVGGRTLSVGRLDTSPTACSLATTAIQTAAVNLPQASSLVQVSGSGSCNASSAPCLSYTFAGPGGSSCTTMVAGDSVTVTAVYPCNLQILWYNFAPTSPCALTSTITERIE